jgi:regulator of nonsense transcripts 3
VRDADGSTVEAKTPKRGGSSGYGSHEVLTLNFWMLNFTSFCFVLFFLFY